MEQIPFTIPEVFSGFAQADGIAAIRPEGLRLQFETTDTVLGVFRSGVREVIVPWADLAEVTLKNDLFGGATLRLRVANLSALANLPGRQGAELVLKVTRSERKNAAAFAEAIRLRLADQSVAEVMERLRRMNAGGNG